MAVLISPDWIYSGLQKIKRKSLLILLTFTIVAGCHSAVFEREIRPAHPSSQVPCRMVKHVMGETCIPNHLERIIAISQFTLANTLALGIKPIAGAFALSDVDGIPQYLQAYTQDIKQLGNQYTPNLEKIALLKPDLILGWQPIHKFYPLLAEISPTAVVPWKGPATPSWQEHFKFLAEVLGREHEYQQA
jgi:iron complex transport system substrate-binding protein